MEVPLDMEQLNVYSALQHLSVPELKLLNDQTRLPFGVCILNLVGDLNTGIIMRTACLMGAERVIVFGRRKFDRRSAVGSQHYIDIEQENGWTDATHETLCPEKFKAVMAKFNYLPVMIETIGHPVHIFDQIPFPDGMKPCLIFGNEGTGIPKNIMDEGYWFLTIPQIGVMRSLNVSSAASIAMWEISKSLKEKAKNETTINS